MNNAEAFKKQSETIAYYRINNPELLLRENILTENEIAEEIGMLNLPPGRAKGYLRFAPQDFIVEENKIDGTVVAVDDLRQSAPSKNNDKENTLYAHLIKIGLPTESALARISQELKVPQNKIGFAGLKDAEAITAQLIAFSNTKLTPEDLSRVNSDQLFLSNFFYGKGSLSPGDLDKNIFTITVRAEKELDENLIRERLGNIKENGILNYYHYQRFGGLRLLSHRLGRFILRGEYEETVKTFLCENNKYDIPLVFKIRQEAASAYKNWEKMEEIFSALPYTFFVEIKFLQYLKNNQEDFIGALNVVSEQTKLWVYAYASWVFNLFISEESKSENGVDLQVPALLSDDALDVRCYQKYLAKDGINNFQFLKPFPFLMCKKRMVDSYLFPEIYDFKVIGKNLIIRFALGKGGYATTFLSNLFELTQGQPVPDWVDKKDYDPKEELGIGSLKELKEIFKNNWKNKE